MGRTTVLAPGFDASLRVAEDVDLTWRLSAAGHVVRYDPEVEIRHRTRTTARAWFERRVFYGTGAAKLAEKHGANGAPARLSPTYAIGAAALLLHRPWSIPIACGAYLRGTHHLRTVLPRSPDSTLIAARVSARGLGSAIAQESGLLLRHWSPPVLVAALVSRTARRLLVAALTIDTAIAVSENRERVRPLGIATLLLGRRADDLAYGIGVCLGACKSGSTRALRPVVVRSVGRRRSARPQSFG